MVCSKRCPDSTCKECKPVIPDWEKYRCDKGDYLWAGHQYWLDFSTCGNPNGKRGYPGCYNPMFPKDPQTTLDRWF